MNTNFIKL